MLPTKLLKTFTNNNQIQPNPKNNPQATCDFFFFKSVDFILNMAE